MWGWHYLHRVVSVFMLRISVIHVLVLCVDVKFCFSVEVRDLLLIVNGDCKMLEFSLSNTSRDIILLDLS